MDKQPGPKGKIAAARQRWPALDRAMRLNDHYGEVNGNLLAGGITYFGFLSFFPLLALAFAGIGYLSHVYPGANDAFVTAISQLLPGIVSEQPAEGKISLNQIQESAAAAGIIGLAGVLYAGLGWITAIREGLAATFAHAEAGKPNFIKGKLTDLIMLVILGIVLLTSVGASSAVTGFADMIISAIGVPESVASAFLWLIGLVVGIGSSTVLFMTMYSFLAKPGLDRAVLYRGALLAAIGFEVLKLLAVLILASASGSAFAPLALSITLVVWINYFARLTIYGAAWSATVRPTTPEV